MLMTVLEKLGYNIRVLSIDALLNSSDGEDKSADEMRQLYLSCPSEARETLLNATRTLSHELKKLMDKSTDQADSSS